MWYYPIVETEAGSGRFVFQPNRFEAASTTAALVAAASGVADGLRVGVSPWEAMGGQPVAVASGADEIGKAYTLYAETGGPGGVFTDASQALTSDETDAASQALLLRLFLGCRVALVSQ